MCRFLRNPYRNDDPKWEPQTVAALAAADLADLHASLTQYRPTPLIELPALARRLGVGRLLVKDESHRFGLKAFKALGATYAVYRHLQQYLATTGRPCPAAADFYRVDRVLEPGELTFCTASDGNHGRGVAWTARKLAQKAVIYLPLETVPARVENIENEGAEVVLVDGTYDDAVKKCAADASANNWSVISDTSWPGYEAIPRWIMAGYLTLFREIETAVDNSAGFDLVIVQGGVGALAGAAAWYFRKVAPGRGTSLVMVEPSEAACLLESLESPGAVPSLSGGRQDSIMAGLNCGYPSPVSWPLVKAGFDMFMTVSDAGCVTAMQSYYNPEASDPRVVSGESGAAGLAALQTLATTAAANEARQILRFDRNLTVLLLNTEGDTDPIGYRERVADTDR